MKAYACVYRASIPKAAHRAATSAAARTDSHLAKFLQDYPDSYLDWGDDPSFFAAREFLNDVRRASWGVCRPDVRGSLDRGDYIAFFCAKPRLGIPTTVDYYFVGVGTVAQVVPRENLWSDDQFKEYRCFYNVLVRFDCGKAVQHETFHPYHEDWRDRLAPYIIFAANDDLTCFNVEVPLHVATYSGDLPEVWNTPELVTRLKRFIFGGHPARRGLRTSRTWFSHPKLKLASGSPQDLVDLRRELLKIARTGGLTSV